jgi:hypothetical protein
MSDKLKSAYELALEKLARKDKASPPDSTAPEKLTARQKAKIAKIRSEVQAKLAEREILFKSEQRSARGDPEKQKVIEEGYRRDRERLLSRQEEQIRDAKREGKDET